jgi:hypothetical protein
MPPSCHFRQCGGQKGTPPAGRGLCRLLTRILRLVASGAQTDYSLLQPDVLTVPFCPHGFDLVARVTSKSTISPFHLRLPSFVFVQILQ